VPVVAGRMSKGKTSDAQVCALIVLSVLTPLRTEYISGDIALDAIAALPGRTTPRTPNGARSGRLRRRRSAMPGWCSGWPWPASPRATMSARSRSPCPPVPAIRRLEVFFGARVRTGDTHTVTFSAERSLDPHEVKLVEACRRGNRRSGLRCCRGNGHRPACLTGGRRPACPGAGRLGGRERDHSRLPSASGCSAAGSQSVTAFGSEVRRFAPVIRAAEARNLGPSDDYWV
jgi:hypothetical protein